MRKSPHKANWETVFKILEDHSEGKPLPSVSLIALETKDPFAILLATLLSLRTRDKVTLETSRRLLEKVKQPSDILPINVSEIERLIYPCAFYRTKAENIKKIGIILNEKYENKVPDSSKALLELPGVGLKTANLVLSLGFNRPVVCVDTHVHRICNRSGWMCTKTPEETTFELEKQLPIKGRIRINELLVIWGQTICLPISPKCSLCPLSFQCCQVNVKKSR